MRFACVWHAFGMRFARVLHAFYMRSACFVHALHVRFTCVFACVLHAFHMRVKRVADASDTDGNPEFFCAKGVLFHLVHEFACEIEQLEGHF